MDKIIIVNFIERPISYTNFKNFDIDKLNIDIEFINYIKNNINVVEPEFKYYDLKKKCDKGICFYIYNDIDNEYIVEEIRKADYIACITNNFKEVKEYIEDINKKCILEFFRDSDNCLLSFVTTMKYIYSIDVEYINIHY